MAFLSKFSGIGDFSHREDEWVFGWLLATKMLFYEIGQNTVRGHSHGLDRERWMQIKLTEVAISDELQRFLALSQPF